jgi:hypothetical protein
VSTLALPAPRSVDAGPSNGAPLATAPSSSGTTSLHRLLLDRLDWAWRLGRMLQMLQPTAASGSGYAPTTIIDEPDPAGRSDDEQTDPLPGKLPRPVERDNHPHEDGVNPNWVPIQPFGV